MLQELFDFFNQGWWSTIGIFGIVFTIVGISSLSELPAGQSRDLYTRHELSGYSVVSCVDDYRRTHRFYKGKLLNFSLGTDSFVECRRRNA